MYYNIAEKFQDLNIFVLFTLIVSVATELYNLHEQKNCFVAASMHVLYKPQIFLVIQLLLQ